MQALLACLVLPGAHLAWAPADFPSPGSDVQIPPLAHRIAGRWDITVETSFGKAPSWVEFDVSGANLTAHFVGTSGSARPVSKVDFSEGGFTFDMPRQYEDFDMRFEGKLEGNLLTGTVTGYDKQPCKWTATRAPTLRRSSPLNWGPPVELFNGKDLSGWKSFGKTSKWSVRGGLLRNAEGGGHLMTTAKFRDFKLHVEFRIPAGSNSGIYLRGRYEVQIMDDAGGEPWDRGSASIYGFIGPCVNMCKKAGEWQTLDITLVGRMVTIVYNGEKVIDRQTIPGITGGALDANEGEPGPIYIQGDHGPIDFRKFTLTPGK